MAVSLRGGSLRCQATTIGAGAASCSGASATNGTPWAEPVMGFIASSMRILLGCRVDPPDHERPVASNSDRSRLDDRPLSVEVSGMDLDLSQVRAFVVAAD